VAPSPKDAVKLEGEEGLFRVRVGSYRILYQVDSPADELLVIAVRHRREAYRKLDRRR
jgi:mRNA interferase RelE/StbE